MIMTVPCANPTLRNWPKGKPLPEDWTVMGKWAVPKWVEAISPPEHYLTGWETRIYLFDGQVWNLMTHEIEED